MGQQVMLTLEDKNLKGYTWVIVLVLASLGYLLILLVSIFPFWVRLMDEETQDVFFSGLFENCFHVKCWKPRPLSIYVLLGRFFLISAVIFAFLTILLTVSSASEFFPRTWKHNAVSASVSFLTGTCAFLAMLLHALEIRDLRMKPSPPQFSIQWPYYVLGLDVLLFLVAGAICLSQGKICLRCRLLSIYQSTDDVQGTPRLEKLESLEGKLSWVQKETRLQEETVI